MIISNAGFDLYGLLFLVPNPDKTPEVNVKTEGLPGNFLVI